MTFVSSKFRYELEVEEKYVKGNKKPDDYEFTSGRQGYQRFHTKEIIDMIDELEELEEKVKQTMNEFCVFVFSEFKSHFKYWDGLINVIAELDCLCSLSLVSFKGDGVMTRPKLV